MFFCVFDWCERCTHLCFDAVWQHLHFIPVAEYICLKFHLALTPSKLKSGTAAVGAFVVSENELSESREQRSEPPRISLLPR